MGLHSLRTYLSDLSWLRWLARSVLMMGDSVRPVVQKPLVQDFLNRQSRYTAALDAGCGRGLYTRLLLPVSDQVTALDDSQEHIETLKRRLGHLPRLSLVEGSADHLPFADNQFDVILHCEVLEHVKDDRKVISELSRVLKSEGRLILSVPVPPAPIEDREHVREGYTLAELRELLDPYHLEIQEYRYCMFQASRSLIQLEAWWKRYFKVPPPSLFLLPVVWERYFFKGTEQDLPYDIVILAQKSVK